MDGPPRQLPTAHACGGEGEIICDPSPKRKEYTSIGFNRRRLASEDIAMNRKASLDSSTKRVILQGLNRQCNPCSPPVRGMLPLPAGVNSPAQRRLLQPGMAQPAQAEAQIAAHLALEQPLALHPVQQQLAANQTFTYIYVLYIYISQANSAHTACSRCFLASARFVCVLQEQPGKLEDRRLSVAGKKSFVVVWLQSTCSLCSASVAGSSVPLLQAAMQHLMACR